MESAAPERKAVARIFRSPLGMVLFGLAARIVYVLIARTYQIDNFNWHQYETANLARSLATGEGYSSPYAVDTGPSAWLAPVYPWMVSLAFRAFGVYSDAAALAVLTLNSVFSALTSWTIYRIASRVFNETVARWSGWAWALLPFAILNAVYWIWDTSLSAFLLSLLFWLTLKMEGDERLASWLIYALVWGLAALTNPSELAWLPFSGCWLAYQLHRHGKRFLAPVFVSAVFFWIVLAPWLIRNFYAFGRPVFLRDNLGNELLVGNNPAAEGMPVLAYHVGRDYAHLVLFKQMGEADFNAEEGDEAKEWIAQNPGRFAVLCFRRFVYFWAGLPRTIDGLPRTPLEKVKNLVFLAFSLLSLGGLVLALKTRLPAVFLFATLLFSYPLIYYITTTQPRYRHPIEPEMLILSVFLLGSIWTRDLPRSRWALARG